MIEIQNLTFKYAADQPPVLQNINLKIQPGEYVAVIGPNGCGKTTLVRHLNALLLPATGDVLVDGLSVRKSRDRAEIRSRVGMIFQNTDNQIVGMTVEEDVAFGPGNLALPPAEVRRRVDEALAKVGLNGLETRPPHTLSGGQKQLLAVAGILAMNPKIIVLDEPTNSLDLLGRSAVLDLLRRLNQQGMAIVLVTHNLEEAAWADRVLVMDQGSIIADGRPEEILTRVGWLKNLGLAPPAITELMWKLRENGAGVNATVFEIEEAFKEIAAWLAELRPEHDHVKTDREYGNA